MSEGSEALTKWVYAEHGRGRRLAQRLGVSGASVSHWCNDYAPIGAKHCRTIESLTGISKHILRPDVFGQPPHSQDALTN